MINEYGSEKMKSYWCSYCGEPTDTSDFTKSWRYQSPKGGKIFTSKIFKCEYCGKKFRITETKDDPFIGTQKEASN